MLEIHFNCLFLSIRFHPVGFSEVTSAYLFGEVLNEQIWQVVGFTLGFENDLLTCQEHYHAVACLVSVDIEA
jgi:hypothetical protein